MIPSFLKQYNYAYLYGLGAALTAVLIHLITMVLIPKAILTYQRIRDPFYDLKKEHPKWR